MIYGTDIQIEPAELNLQGPRVNKKCLVNLLIVVAHYQNTIVGGSRKRQDCLEPNVHLRKIDVD